MGRAEMIGIAGEDGGPIQKGWRHNVARRAVGSHNAELASRPGSGRTRKFPIPAEPRRIFKTWLIALDRIVSEVLQIRELEQRRLSGSVACGSEAVTAFLSLETIADRAS
jgi:hypothetical protein